MESTSSGLLLRLRNLDDQEAWDRFVELYTPLLFYWARRGFGLQTADAADLVQDVLAHLLVQLPCFDFDRDGTFRGWLRVVLLNRHRLRGRRSTWPARRQPEPLPPDGGQGSDDIANLTESEYRRYVARRALDVMRNEFEPPTWKACWAVVVEGRRAGEVAAELGLSVASVYQAKSRVLRRLRQELGDLLN